MCRGEGEHGYGRVCGWLVVWWRGLLLCLFYDTAAYGRFRDRSVSRIVRMLCKTLISNVAWLTALHADLSVLLSDSSLHVA